MKKVILTGASGFVGQHCLLALARLGYEVHALSLHRQVDTPDDIEIHWHRIDVLDADQVTELIKKVGPTHLLHCAWYAEPGKYWEATENYQWAEASLRLFQTFAKFGGQRSVGVGSCAEYDWAFGRCSEFSTPLNPASTYGVCKNRLRSGLEDLGKETGLSAAWARLFFLYGPHERPERFVPSVINTLLRGETMQCSSREKLRDYVYIKDAAEALVSLLDSSVLGPVNIASGLPSTIGQIADVIGRKLGRTELLRFGDFRNEEPLEVSADTARLNNEVGWSPQYGLDRGMEETINWWKLKGAAASSAN